MPDIEEAKVITTEVSLRDRALTELSKVNAGLTEMKEKYGAKVYDCSKTMDMAHAKADRLAIREVRYRVPKIADEVTKQLNAAKAEVKGEAERIVSELLAIENISHNAIIEEENRKENEKQAKAEAERKRTGNIQELIARIRAIPSLPISGSESLATCIEQTKSIIIDPATFMEFVDEAELAKNVAISIMTGSLNNALAAEEEQRKIEADRKELEELREKQAEMQRQLDEINAKEQERLDAEKALIEEKRIAHEKKMAEEQALAAEAEAKLKARQDEIDRIRFDEETARQREAEEKQEELDRIAEEERQERERKANEEKAAAELKAKEAEKARRAAEKTAKLAEAKCLNIETALANILVICREHTQGDTDGYAQIALIVEANGGVK